MTLSSLVWSDQRMHAGVGENPEFMKKKQQRDARKRAKKAEKMGYASKSGAVRMKGMDSGDVDLNILYADDYESSAWSGTTFSDATSSEMTE